MTTTTAPAVRERTRAKSRVLLEALPYIREHSGKVVVVKLGGAAMDDPALAGSFAEDVGLLRLVGMRPVVLHGGGPQVSELSERLGLTTEFRGGLRVTDVDTLRVAKIVLVGDGPSRSCRSGPPGQAVRRRPPAQRRSAPNPQVRQRDPGSTRRCWTT